MTASDILSLTDVYALTAAAREAWQAGNDAGEGCAPNLDGAELIYASPVDDVPSVYRRGNIVVLVADANGPWAVELA